MKIDPSKYPLVTCAMHPEHMQRGYVVCGRVAKDYLAVATVIAPTNRRMGQIVCDGKTHNHDASSTKDAELVCERCAREKGWIQ